MDPVAAAILSSWSLEPTPVLVVLLATALYLRGFRELHAQLPGHFPRWRRSAFLAGIFALSLALVSPLDALADLLLQVHLSQHWLLMMVAPPLLWLGTPAVPLLRGLPRSALRRGLGPFLAWRGLRELLRRVTRPVFAWPAWALTTLLWHWPPAYELAVRSRSWHDLEHLMFLVASLLFWYPVVAPWPERRHAERAGIVLHLGLAAVFNTLFSAVFAFSDRVFYPLYQDAPRLFGVDALTDQNAAGAFLWAAASLPMTFAAVAVLLSLLEPTGAPPLPLRAPRRAARLASGGGSAARAASRWLRSRSVRRALQGAMLALALVLVADGLLGPQQPAAQKHAGVLPWTYWRGFAVIALLLLGNAVCAVCPFTLSRRLAGRWLGRGLRWPAALRGKWLPAGLLALFLWAYEVCAPWDSPAWTAWIVLGYFAACFLVEGLFPRGTFCRHVCPIGNFQFVGSGVSPLEVRATDTGACSHCRTHDCLRGNAASPGCPTGLFLPTKRGGLDCTFCLDCVRACPHGSAGVAAAAPGASLGRGAPQGLDAVALVLVFCFGAFANAAAMVEPVARLERSAATRLGAASTLPIETLWLAIALLLVPAAATAACALLSRSLAGRSIPTRRLVASFAPALVPVGFAMWLAHFGFHLLTGLGSLAPAAGRAARDLGLAATGTLATGASAAISPAALAGLEIAALGAGLVLSVAVAWRIACELSAPPGRALALTAPWALLALALYGLGVWIVLQPMEMRGMVMT